MKRLLLTTVLLLLAVAAPASAAVVNVRIEGASSTLFEGPIVATGHNVQSLSERQTGAIRRCDGTNNGASQTVVPTGTAATSDALSLQNQGFDGAWYDDYEDYLIGRLGNERASWRLFKNLAFSTVGGCQMRLADGDQVLWANGSGSALGLTLSGSTATTTPGAEIYVAGADGSQGASLGVADSGSFDLSGRLAPGAWYRIKARKAGALRSNRVDYCPGACPAQPADMSVRTPPSPVFYAPRPGGGIAPLANSPALSTTLSALRVARPVTSRSAYRRGRIAVRWKITQPGTGLRRWVIASDDLSTKAKRYSTRAKGTTQTSALLSLPAGRVHALRFTSTDRLGNDDAIGFGRVLVPIDDRARQVKRSGSWRKARSSKAWKGTLLRGGRGARASVRLAAGRPALVLGGKGRATVRVGSKTLRVKGGRTVFGPKRGKAGRVTITVVRGSISLDGLAASP